MSNDSIKLARLRAEALQVSMTTPSPARADAYRELARACQRILDLDDERAPHVPSDPCHIGQSTH
jgi:ribosomal protein S11